MKCQLCGTKNDFVYIGAFRAECTNPKCDHFSKKAKHKLDECMSVEYTDFKIDEIDKGYFLKPKMIRPFPK